MQLGALALAAVALAGDQAMVTGHLYTDSAGVLVVAPVASASVDVSEEVTLSGKVLVDAISAASWNIDTVSGASPKVEEWRRAGTLGVQWERDTSRYGAFADHSREDDWVSTSAGVSWARDFAKRCFTIDLSWFHTHDVIDPNRTATDLDATKDTDSVRLTLTQVLSRYAVGSLTYNLLAVRGYQANPYYTDIASYAEQAPVYLAEDLPEARNRHAATARLDQWIAPLRGAVHPTVRAYGDDWGIRSLTGEISYAQHLGHSLIAGVRTRHYVQSDDQLSEATVLDHRFEALSSHMVGGQLIVDLEPIRRAIGWEGAQQVRAHAAYDHYRRHHDDWVLGAHIARVGLDASF